MCAREVVIRCMQVSIFSGDARLCPHHLAGSQGAELCVAHNTALSAGLETSSGANQQIPRLRLLSGFNLDELQWSFISSLFPPCFL